MCWRTYFLRRMKSQTKGTHYNICACARKGTTEGWKKTRRYGRALHDTRVLTCLTSGSRHVRHPGLGMHDTRVSARLTPGSRYARHPGVGHKKKANRTNGTGRKQYGHIQGKEIQTEKVNTILKNISVHCFCTANQSSFFLNSILHFLPTIVCVYSHWQKIPPYTPFCFSHFLIYVLLTL